MISKVKRSQDLQIPCCNLLQGAQNIQEMMHWMKTKFWKTRMTPGRRLTVVDVCRRMIQMLLSPHQKWSGFVLAFPKDNSGMFTPSPTLCIGSMGTTTMVLGFWYAESGSLKHSLCAPKLVLGMSFANPATVARMEPAWCSRPTTGIRTVLSWHGWALMLLWKLCASWVSVAALCSRDDLDEMHWDSEGCPRLLCHMTMARRDDLKYHESTPLSWWFKNSLHVQKKRF